jgi:hypothetical protein
MDPVARLSNWRTTAQNCSARRCWRIAKPPKYSLRSIDDTVRRSTLIRVRNSLTVGNLKREVWSLFSGAMGLDLGLEQAGLPATLACELEPIYCRTITANRPNVTLIEGDARNLTGNAMRAARGGFEGDVFLIAGGPPCQSYSSGGKRQALSDPRGGLVRDFFRIVDEVRPQYFIMENVANLATAAIKHRPIDQRPGKHWSLKKYERGAAVACA